ncbi:deoxyribose-phosphate aldolase [Mesoplasma syrphidae]|uniref:Deoxyribose-phosphate aldolase n=1 Tax=Mesoplasma syrphidae TaxID=225999 RepID=A0A2K9C6E3_9MOLU|nr:deoxyribose-phosphate aldolase [Mesoplasma syrphidae]AUF83857.1 deoxyribose-phosphate aldolase [Mesoplasma syrphidae]
MKLNKYIDHTLLKPEATKSQIINLCNEAKEYDFATVCVNSYWTKFVKSQLRNSTVGITTVIGFPLGACSTETKVFETIQAIKDGSDEIDMVINIGALKDQDYQAVLADMKAVKNAAQNKIVKCIMENCLLSKEEIATACNLALEAGLDYVKTSTGFSSHGATIEDVALMNEIVKDKALVKAAGGVRNYQEAIAMIDAGASRLGTSGGVAIVKGKEHNQDY